MPGDGVVRIIKFEGGRGMKTAVCGTVVVGVASRGLDGFSLLAIVYVSVDQVVLYLPRHGEFRRPSPLWQGVCSATASAFC